jgi:hypothetical protein
LLDTFESHSHFVHLALILGLDLLDLPAELMELIIARPQLGLQQLELMSLMHDLVLKIGLLSE